MGVILYISAVNDEVAHRKKSPAGGNGGSGSGSVVEFSYSYGWAFFFGGATFVCAMAAAVSNISLYLHRYSHFDEMMLIVPSMVSSGSGTTAMAAGGGPESSGGVGGGGDGSGVYRPVRWADPDDDRRCTTSLPRWVDVESRKLSMDRAERRLYESNHSISIPL